MLRVALLQLHAHTFAQRVHRMLPTRIEVMNIEKEKRVEQNIESAEREREGAALALPSAGRKSHLALISSRHDQLEVLALRGAAQGRLHAR